MVKQLLTLAAAAVMGVAASAATYELDLDQNLFFWNNSTYDTTTHTITYNTAWDGAGWGFWNSVDFTGFDQFVIEFEPTDILVQLFVQYTDEPDNYTAQALPGETKCVIDLVPEFCDHVAQIMIQNDKPGTLTLNRAYFITKEDAPIDYVLFTGEHTVDWWGEALQISSRRLKETLQEGYTFAINYSLTPEAEYGALKLLALKNDWSNEMVPFSSNIEEVGTGTYQPEYQTISVTEPYGVVALTVDAASLEMLTSNNLQYMMICGENVIINAVQVINYTSGIYAVGEFQGWDPASAVALTPNDDSTVFTFDTSSSVQSLKLSTVPGVNWSIYNLGAFAPAEALQDGVAASYSHTDADILLPYAGYWTITVNTVDGTITATAAAAPQEPVWADIYLRGGMNGWGAEESYKFSSEDGFIYTLEVPSVSASDEWKIADNGWSAYDLGYNNVTVNLGYDYTIVMDPRGKNCMLARDAQSVKFILEILTNKLTVVDAAGVVDLVNDAADAVYYNMQGMQISNPKAGEIVIVKRGAKISKEVIR